MKRCLLSVRRFQSVVSVLRSISWVPNFEVSITAKAEKESVGAEFDVVAHHGGIHADEFNRKGVDNELHFDCDGAADDLNDS